MDTRSKIVELDTALARVEPARTAVVTGYFDPLTAHHARRLRQIRAVFEHVLVLLLNPPEPILEAAARAQLVAALETIDYVVLPPARDPSGDLERSAGFSMFHEEMADEERFDRLVKNVHRRHQAVSR